MEKSPEACLKAAIKVARDLAISQPEMAEPRPNGVTTVTAALIADVAHDQYEACLKPGSSKATQLPKAGRGKTQP